MTKKPIDLSSAGLVTVKGKAAAAPDANQRSPVITAPLEVQKSELVPLQFRVSEEFREAFEQYAFNSKPRRKLVDVLRAAFDALKEKEKRQ